jgi:hypothetical protein
VFDYDLTKKLEEEQGNSKKSKKAKKDKKKKDKKDKKKDSKDKKKMKKDKREKKIQFTDTESGSSDVDEPRVLLHFFQLLV